MLLGVFTLCSASYPSRPGTRVSSDLRSNVRTSLQPANIWQQESNRAAGECYWDINLSGRSDMGLDIS
jgi:hypothetical protein